MHSMVKLVVIITINLKTKEIIILLVKDTDGQTDILLTERKSIQTYSS